MPELIPKRERFCREYIIDHNATQAYIRAGYSENGARQSSSTLLANTDIAKRVEELEVIERARLSENYRITKERILLERSRLAFFDPRKLYHEDGSLKQPHEWDDDTAAVVASVKEKEIWSGTGKDREKIGTTVEIRFWNKDGSLSALEKIEGMYEKDNDQKNPFSHMTPEQVAKRLEELKEKALS